MEIISLYEKFIDCNQRISTDTRMIENGSLFFAWKGENNDGNAYAKEALEKGAQYAVIDDSEYLIDERTILVKDSMKTLQQLAYYHRKQFHIPVIAIGGSNGKTTTKELLASILKKQKNVVASFGSHNNHVGVPKTLLRINRLTNIAVIEMGANHRGEIAALCEIACPTIGLITNIGRDHIGLFGGPGAVVEANLELYEYLKRTQGTIFVNAADELLLKYTQGAATVVKYGENTTGAQLLRSLKTVPYVSFTWKNYKVMTQLTGEYNIENIAAATAVAVHQNITDENITRSVSSFKPNSNRSELYTSDKGNLIIKDFYNANRTSMELSLTNLESLQKNNVDRKSIAILGDMFELGGFSREEHEAVISHATSLQFDEVILIGDQFRKCQKPDNYIIFASTDDAISALKSRGFKNSLILLKASNGMHFQKLFDAIDW